jgi:N-acetylneuraminic acid mutarotase
MFIWGGFNSKQALDDGKLYDPVEDSWRSVSAEGALEARGRTATVWTGKEVIIWGGCSRDEKRYFQDGARYNPATDTWRTISKVGPPKGRVHMITVWTGREMLVWGGVNDANVSGTGDRSRYLGSGAFYDPETDSWTPTPSANAPSPRLISAAIWSGDAVLIFGGYDNVHRNDTYLLHPK